MNVIVMSPKKCGNDNQLKPSLLMAYHKLESPDGPFLPVPEERRVLLFRAADDGETRYRRREAAGLAKRFGSAAALIPLG